MKQYCRDLFIIGIPLFLLLFFLRVSFIPSDDFHSTRGIAVAQESGGPIGDEFLEKIEPGLLEEAEKFPELEVIVYLQDPGIYLFKLADEIKQRHWPGIDILSKEVMDIFKKNRSEGPLSPMESSLVKYNDFSQSADISNGRNEGNRVYSNYTKDPQFIFYDPAKPSLWNFRVGNENFPDDMGAYGGSYEDYWPIIASIEQPPQGIIAQEATIQQDVTQEFTATIDSSIEETVFSAAIEGSDIDLVLVRPDETVIDPALAESDPWITFFSGEYYESYHVSSPMSGYWQMQVTGTEVAPEGELITASVSALCALKLSVDIDTAGYPQGDSITFTAQLEDSLGPITGSLVNAVIKAPSNTLYSLALADDGKQGDTIASDSVYACLFNDTEQEGLYEFEFRASGISNLAEPFTRLKTGSFKIGSDADKDGQMVWEGDCDESNPLIYKGAPEECNNIDDNCNNEIDDGFDFQTDVENCGVCGHICEYAHAGARCRDGICEMLSCDPWYWDINSETVDGCEYYCEYSNDRIEVCDELDNDCDGTTDNEGIEGCTLYYRDDDKDGYGADGDTKCLCIASGEYTVREGGDPDDADPSIPFISVSMVLNPGWSLISLPVEPENRTLLSLFPEAIVVYEYEKGSGYIRIKEGEELEIGRGYWVLTSEAKTYDLIGSSIHEYSVSVTNGWYLIGSCSNNARPELDSGSVVVIYSYEQGLGYQRISEGEKLEPGYGYWVLINNLAEGGEFELK